MSLHRIAYLANIRLPTEKAHGFQIMKMCQAFSHLDVNVTLYHPQRKQTPELRGKSPFEYYGIPPSIEIRSLRNLDVVQLENVLPSALYRRSFSLQALLWGRFAASHVIKEGGADLYYTRDVPIAYWLTRADAPTVLELHVIPGGRERSLLSKVARSNALCIGSGLTSFIVNDMIELGLPESKAVVLTDAVDLERFHDLPSQAECRRRLDLPPDQPIIGYVGRFQTMGQEKGLPELIGAVAQMPPVAGDEAMLLCVGGPMDAASQYQEIAQQCFLTADRLRLEDRVPNREVPSWMRACDIVTIPWPWTEFSAYSTSPMKMFEYMASGTPIVSSDLPSIREVLRHGENAWLVEPGDPAALAEGITTLLQNPDLATRLANQARQDVVAYTWEKRARNILDILKGNLNAA